jgi:hypothetical protein
MSESQHFLNIPINFYSLVLTVSHYYCRLLRRGIRYHLEYLDHPVVCGWAKELLRTPSGGDSEVEILDRIEVLNGCIYLILLFPRNFPYVYIFYMLFIHFYSCPGGFPNAVRSAHVSRPPNST